MVKEATTQAWLTEVTGTTPLTAAASPSRTSQASCLDPLSDPQWDAKLDAQDVPSFFATQSWARVLRDSYGFEPKYFTGRAGERFDGLLPVMEISSPLTGRRGVSLPFSDLCEPLAEDENSFRQLFAQVIAYGRARSWKYLEIRGGRRFLEGSPVYQRFYTHELSLLRDPQLMFAKLDSSVRRAIRKAEKNSVTVEMGTDLSAIKRFYSLQCRTRRKHGLPPQPFRFFESLQKHVLAPGHGMIFLARSGAAAIAASVFLRRGPQAIYKFGASDESCQHLRGNDVVMWEGIKHLASQGCTTLHLGRTSLANEGLRRFKLGWGARESMVDYFRFDLRQNAFVTGRDEAFGWYNKFFSLLPLSISRLIGGILYRHVG